MNKTENYVREFYEIFFSQKKMIFWTTVVVFAISILIAFFWPPTYSGTGSILVKGKKVERSPSTLSTVTEQFYPVTKEDLVSEEQTLTSFDVVKNTLLYLKEKGLFRKSRPGFLSSIFETFRMNGSKPQKIKLASSEKGKATSNFPELVEEVYKVLGKLKTEVIPSSNVIKLTYFDRDPEYATLIVNTIMQQYLLFRKQVGNPNQAEIFYQKQARRIKKIIDQKNQELLKETRVKTVSNPKREIEANIVLKSDLERQLNTLRQKIIEKEKFIHHLDKTLKSKNLEFFSFITADQSRIITDISASLFNAVVERENMLEKYKPQSLKVRLLDKKIRALSRSLRKEIGVYKSNQESELKGFKQRAAFLEKKIADLNERNVILSQIDVKMENLKWDLATLRKSYATLLKREEEAKINTAVNKTNMNYFVTILNKAFPSNGPVFPKKGVVIPLGLLIGFIIGCSFGFLRDYFDHTFKKPSDVEAYIGLPVLFSIPKSENRIKKVMASIIFAFAFLIVFGTLSTIKHHARTMAIEPSTIPILKSRKFPISPRVTSFAPPFLSKKKAFWEFPQTEGKGSKPEYPSMVLKKGASAKSRRAGNIALISSERIAITCCLR